MIKQQQLSKRECASSVVNSEVSESAGGQGPERSECWVRRVRSEGLDRSEGPVRIFSVDI